MEKRCVSVRGKFLDCSIVTFPQTIYFVRPIYWASEQNSKYRGHEKLLQMKRTMKEAVLGIVLLFVFTVLIK